MCLCKPGFFVVFLVSRTAGALIISNVISYICASSVVTCQNACHAKEVSWAQGCIHPSIHPNPNRQFITGQGYNQHLKSTIGEGMAVDLTGGSYVCVYFISHVLNSLFYLPDSLF